MDAHLVRLRARHASAKRFDCIPYLPGIVDLLLISKGRLTKVFIDNFSADCATFAARD